MNYGPIYMPIYGGGEGTAPAVTSAPVITGTAQVGQTLTVTPAVFTGDPAPTVTRQWEKSTGGAYTAIAGATDLTYDPVVGDVGATIRVTETATNSKGTVTSSSDPTAAVVAAE